jgi:hypothetical protein
MVVTYSVETIEEKVLSELHAQGPPLGQLCGEPRSPHLTLARLKQEAESVFRRRLGEIDGKSE